MPVGGQALDAAEELLVLELLVGEAHQRLERDLVAEPVLAAHFEHLGADEALDQAEHVGVGAALDLAEEAPLVRREEVELARPSTGRRAGTCGEIEARGRGSRRASMSQRMRLETSMHLA